MNIGIIGAGRIGGTLARHLAKLGHRVAIANSRDPRSLEPLAAEIGARAVAVEEAAHAGEMVIVSIPLRAVRDLPKGLFHGVPESVAVIDTGNYYPETRDGHIHEIDEGMPDSVWVAQQIERPVLKVFNNIYAESLRTRPAPKGDPRRVALSAAGDAPQEKDMVLRLLDELGFDPVEAGPLAESWRQQPGTPAYCRDLDVPALEHALAEADRTRIPEYRAQAEALVRGRKAS